MHTAMNNSVFDALLNARHTMSEHSLDPAGIFVPWLGDRIANGEAGLYYVGMATAGCFGSNERQTLDDCYARTVHEIHNHRKYTSFWRFLAGLTGELLSDKPEATLSGWEWSNFLKIGHCTEKKPTKEMVELEADACRQSLAAEIAAIKNSLIFVASADDFGMMDVISGSASNWQKSYENDGIWYQMVAHENLLIHRYHPNFAYLDGFFDQMLNRTTELARKHLPGLARRRSTKSPIGAA